VLIYAWNPLVTFELFYSGHLESFLLPPLLGFLYLFLRGRLAGAAAALGLATAIKLVPALLLFAVPRGSRVRTATPFVFVVVTAYLLFAEAAAKILGFLPSYFSDPYEMFNLGLIQEGLFWAANALSLPSSRVRYVLLLVLLAILTVMARRPYTSLADLIEKSTIALGAYLLVIYPAFHPWYLIPLIPLLCIRPSHAWIYFSLALPLSYIKYLTADGIMPAWVTWWQFGPLYVLLAFTHPRISRALRTSHLQLRPIDSGGKEQGKDESRGVPGGNIHASSPSASPRVGPIQHAGKFLKERREQWFPATQIRSYTTQ
jgi:hypothetical protein